MKPNLLARRIPVVAMLAGMLLISRAPVVSGRASDVPAKADARTVMHVLNRITYGARRGDVERVQKMGLAAYIDEQLHPDRIPDEAVKARLASFETLGMSSKDLADKYYIPADEVRRDQQLKQQKAEAKTKQSATGSDMAGDMKDAKPAAQLPPEVRAIQQAQQNVMNELMQARLLRSVMSDRQLDEVLADFWFNHFNVFVGKGQVRQYLTEYERDVIRPNVLGSFRDLLGAVAHSPAMLFYLDNFQSSTPNATVLLSPQLEQRLRDSRLNPAQRQQLQQRLQQMKNQQKNQPRGLNENYGRELMELHTLGVDGGYTQKDVIEVARALTGWTIDQPRRGGGFVFNPRMHDTGEKTILGVHFPAGGGQDEGERVLDLLAKHPATAHHIAYKLAQRFVSDEPPAELVDRAAKRFLDTKGDLREVVRTIITSPEFFADDVDRVKVKSPLEFVVSAVRASGATVINAQPLVQQMRDLGMPLYGCQPPTGYSMTSDAWINTGALLNRMNFAVQLVGGGQPAGPPQRGRGAGAIGGQPPPARGQQPPRPLVAQGGRGPGAQLRAPLQIDVRALVPDTSEATRDALIEKVFAGRVSETTRQTLARAETPQQLLALIIGSPEFQRR
jgi:uncharacterized protein (DUF1800 family)